MCYQANIFFPNRCFAIHTPSSNPRLPKNLHFTETLRRPVRSLQQKVTNYISRLEYTFKNNSLALPPYWITYLVVNYFYLLKYHFKAFTNIIKESSILTWIGLCKFKCINDTAEKYTIQSINQLVLLICLSGIRWILGNTEWCSSAWKGKNIECIRQITY